MSKTSFQGIGRKLQEKRGDAGVRETAKLIGISPATLSRIEHGNVPDLETFGKVCKWLQVDPGEILGVKHAPTTDRTKLAVHFRKADAVKPETASALATMILAAQRALAAQGEE